MLKELMEFVGNNKTLMISIYGAGLATIHAIFAYNERMHPIRVKVSKPYSKMYPSFPNNVTTEGPFISVTVINNSNLSVKIKDVKVIGRNNKQIMLIEPEYHNRVIEAKRSFDYEFLYNKLIVDSGMKKLIAVAEDDTAVQHYSSNFIIRFLFKNVLYWI